MPAIVRGGRRQAAPGAKSGGKPAARAAQDKGAPKGRRKKAGGKQVIMGSVAMPAELTGWLAGIVVVGLLAAVLLTNHRAETLRDGVVRFADERVAQLGLNLQTVRLVGVSPQAADDIKKALPFHRGDPLAFMDINAVRDAVEKVGWVKSATVQRQFPGSLIVTVKERPRLAVWQNQHRDFVIDDTGQIIPEAHAERFPDLPLVVGEGANETATDVLELMRARPQLLAKTYALQRIDTRRWNILLKNGAVIKLPALDQDRAFARLDALIAQRRVLDQGFAEIDLLDPNALVVVPLQARAGAPAPQ
ncbi:MAG: cell division protein FtsQ/DivIB [Asticcacaulis sp.]